MNQEKSGKRTNRIKIKEARKMFRKVVSIIVILSFALTNTGYAVPMQHRQDTLRTPALQGSEAPLAALTANLQILTQDELKQLYEAQEAGNWETIQDAQQKLKSAFLATYEQDWQEFQRQNPDIKPLFDMTDSDEQEGVIPPEEAIKCNLTPADEDKKPTGHLKEFFEKSDQSTAGIRSFVDPLHSENPEMMYNDRFMAILVQAEAEFLQGVHRKIQAYIPAKKDTAKFEEFIDKLRRNISKEDIKIIEKIYGMPSEDIIVFLKHNIVKLVGGEVRPHTAKFVEMETRILAANGIKVIVPVNYSDSVTIYMYSFLTYLLGACGATHCTPSHSANYVFGRKALAPDGAQLLPDVYDEYREILKRIIEQDIPAGNYTIKMAAADDENIIPTLTYDRMVKLYRYILNIPQKDVDIINKATAEGHKVVLNCLNGSTWKTLRPLFEEIGIKLNVFELMLKDEDPYFDAGYVVTSSKDEGTGEVTYGIDHLGIDTTMPEVVRTIPYPKELAGKPAGRRIYECDPDSDRFVIKQIMEKEAIPLLDKYGIDYYELGDNRILAAPSPNKSFLVLDIVDYEYMVENKLWDQFQSLYFITYVSSRAWVEFAEAVDGLIRIMSRVGYKCLTELQRTVEGWYDARDSYARYTFWDEQAEGFVTASTVDALLEQMEARSYPDSEGLKREAEGWTASTAETKAFIFKDQLGRYVTIDDSKKIRIHCKEEESGGRVAGLNKPCHNLLGQSVLAMPEKSVADSLIAELIFSSKLFLQNGMQGDYLFTTFINDRFDRYGLKSNVDKRIDLLSGDQGEIARLPYKEKQKTSALCGTIKDNFNNFFFSLAEAFRDGKISLEQVKKILTEALPHYAETWACLKEVFLAEEPLSGGRKRPEGVSFIFEATAGNTPMVTEFDFRPSGTDPLKSKVYIDAEQLAQKQYERIKKYFEALMGKYGERAGYNLYAVLEHYGITPSIPKPDNFDEVDFKTLELDKGPEGFEVPKVDKADVDLTVNETWQKANATVMQRIRNDVVNEIIVDKNDNEIKEMLRRWSKEVVVKIDGNTVSIEGKQITLPEPITPFAQSPLVMQMAITGQVIRRLIQLQRGEVDWEFLYGVIDTTDANLGIGIMGRLKGLIATYLPNLDKRVSNETADALDKISGIEDVGRIVFCGMGGSGVGGNVLAGIVSELELEGIEVIVVKEFEIPQYILDSDKDNTLYILSSFSGTTQETCEMAEKLAELKKTKVVAISSGEGARLGQFARDQGWSFMSLVEAGHFQQPREALPITALRVKSLLEYVLDKKEITTDALKTDGLFDALQGEFDKIQTFTRATAQQMYEKGKIPLVITDGKGLSQAMATRIMQQFAECPFMPCVVYTQDELRNSTVDLEKSGLFTVFTIGEVSLPQLSYYHKLDEIISLMLAVEGRPSIIERIYFLEAIVSSIAYNMAVVRGVEPIVVPLITGDGINENLPAYKPVLKEGTPLYEKMMFDFKQHSPHYPRISDIEEIKDRAEIIDLITTQENLQHAMAVRDNLLKEGKLAYITLLPEGNHNQSNSWLPFFAHGTNAEKITYVLMTSNEELAEADWLKATAEYFLSPTGRFYLYARDYSDEYLQTIALECAKVGIAGLAPIAEVCRPDTPEAKASREHAITVLGELQRDIWITQTFEGRRPEHHEQAALINNLTSSIAHLAFDLSIRGRDILKESAAIVTEETLIAEIRRAGLAERAAVAERAGKGPTKDEWFIIVAKKVPQTLANVSNAFGATVTELAGRADSGALTIEQIDGLVSRQADAFNLSPRAAELLRVALIAPGQGQGPSDKVEAIIQRLPHGVANFVETPAADTNESSLNAFKQMLESDIGALEEALGTAPEEMAARISEPLQIAKAQLQVISSSQEDASFVNQINEILDEITSAPEGETAAIATTAPIMINEEDLQPVLRRVVVNFIRANRELLVQRYGTNVILKAEFENNPTLYDVSKMVVLSSTLVAGAEKARYLDMATLSGKDAFFDIAKALAIARAFSSYIITQDERIKLLLLNLLRRKGVEAVDGELEQQLMQFVNREGFILKLQLPAPRAIIKEGLYEEAYRLALQALIAA